MCTCMCVYVSVHVVHVTGLGLHVADQQEVGRRESHS